MLLKSDTMSLQQLVQSTSVYKTACLWNQFHTAQYGSGQGKGILIAGMAPDLSYDNTRSERLNFSGMKWK